MKPIDYRDFKDNIENMINLLEYDAQRSPGKMKVNAQHLFYLHQLRKHYNNYKLDPDGSKSYSQKDKEVK